MTHIVDPKRFPSKKSLRTAMEAGEGVLFSDPSIFEPRSYYSLEMPVGTTITCTNHPKRSWFASVTRKDDGSFSVR